MGPHDRVDEQGRELLAVEQLERAGSRAVRLERRGRLGVEVLGGRQRVDRQVLLPRRRVEQAVAVDDEGRHVVRQRLGGVGRVPQHELTHALEERAAGLRSGLEVTVHGIRGRSHARHPAVCRPVGPSLVPREPVSRRCREGRGRPAPGAGRATTTAPPGRRPAARPTVPSPTSSREPGQQAGGEQPQLGGPGGGVGPHGEHAVDEVDRRAVLGDLGADDLRPAPDDGAHRDVDGPARAR